MQIILLVLFLFASFFIVLMIYCLLKNTVEPLIYFGFMEYKDTYELNKLDERIKENLKNNAVIIFTEKSS